MPKSLTRPLNKKQVVGLKATAAKYFGVLLNDEQAQQVGRDQDLRPEIGPRGEFDTYGRDYLIMAIIEVVLPGPPAVQDDLLGGKYEWWHWPCFGSSTKYSKAFYTAFKKAAKAKGVQLAPGFPG
ncbi:MAG: hypothetical protein ACREGR_00315 [Minisyncoccia bacterium]